MTKGRKTGGRDIVKGEVRNPTGRPKALRDLSDLQHFTRAELLKAMCEQLAKNAIQLRIEVEDGDGSAAEAMIGSVIMKAIDAGCYNRANFICQYILGRPKTYEHVEDPEGFKPANLEGVPSQFLIEVIKASLKAQEENAAASRPAKASQPIKSQ